MGNHNNEVQRFIREALDEEDFDYSYRSIIPGSSSLCLSLLRLCLHAGTVQLHSKLIPEPLGTNILCAEISTTLLGQRNTGSKVSGVNVNTLLSLGGFWKSDDNGLGIMLGLTPIALGSPSNVRRERCLRTNVGWDFRNKKLIVLFSPMDVEIYIKGTYRDWM